MELSCEGSVTKVGTPSNYYDIKDNSNAKTQYIYIYIQIRKHFPLVSVEKKCKYIMLNIGLVSSELKKYIYIGY